MKIAILHEMLIKIGGAEKVVESICRLYPQADLYTLIYDEKKIGNIFPKGKIHASYHKLLSQKIYNIFGKQRLCLPFMIQSVESLDFSSYDIVIVSSSGFAHGLKKGPHTKTLIYYHAPARYMWDWTHEYRREMGYNTGIRGFLFGRLLLKFRQWDYEIAQKNDVLLANSATTQKRIWKYYRRNADILYPPIETQRFAQEIPSTEKGTIIGNYYIILSALTEFKRIDVALKYFPSNTDLKLIVIGNGNYRESLEAIAGKNVIFVGTQYGDDLVALVQNSLGLIFPGEEDFGIVPIEVMAAGKPVFALKKGGLTETVLEGKTGEFFQDSEGKDFGIKFEEFHTKNIENTYLSANCKKQAAQFDTSIFHKKLSSTVKNISS